MEMDTIYITSAKQLNRMPLIIRCYFDQNRVFLRLKTLMGLINHSELIRGRVGSAIYLKKETLDIHFSIQEMDNQIWLVWLGYVRPILKRDLDLEKFLAFAHTQMFTQELVNSILRYHRYSRNRSLVKAIYYCKKILGWHDIAEQLFTISLDFRRLDIQEKHMRNAGTFRKFVRSAKRSTDRYNKHEKYHDHYNGGTKYCHPSRNCVICYAPAGYLLDPFKMDDNSPYMSHTCPSALCTSQATYHTFLGKQGRVIQNVNSTKNIM